MWQNTIQIRFSFCDAIYSVYVRTWVSYIFGLHAPKSSYNPHHQSVVRCHMQRFPKLPNSSTNIRNKKAWAQFFVKEVGSMPTSIAEQGIRYAWHPLKTNLRFITLSSPRSNRSSPLERLSSSSAAAAAAERPGVPWRREPCSASARVISWKSPQKEEKSLSNQLLGPSAVSWPFL